MYESFETLKNIRGDYNLSSKWKFFTRFVNNSDAVTSYYGSFVLGSSIPLVPITDARPGKALASPKLLSTTTPPNRGSAQNRATEAMIGRNKRASGYQVVPSVGKLLMQISETMFE